jgi:hypothetical protein
MSSKPVMITLGLNYDGTKKGLADVRNQMRQLDAATKEMGHGTVSSMQAASASIRLFEGGISNSIRAAERLISTMPGVSAALQGIFPLVGAAAIGGIFLRVGEEVAEFVKKMNTIPPNPFGEMIASGKIANDQLAIGNDRLAMEIAKLEHKPVNGMAMALDQARESSDKLFKSLTDSSSAFTEAMEKMKVSTMQGLWRHEVPTDEADQNITSNRKGVQKVWSFRQQIVDDALQSNDPANIAQAKEAQMKAAQKAYGIMDSNLRYLISQAEAAKSDSSRSYSVGADPSVALQKYVAALNQSQVDQKSIGEQYGQSIMQPKKDSLDAAKANDSQQAKRLQKMEEGFAKQKAMYGASTADELAYWSARISAFTEGSEQFHTVLMETFKLQSDLYKEMSEGKKKYLESAKGDVEGNDLLSRGADAFAKYADDQKKRDTASTREYNAIVAKGAQEQEKATTAFAAAGIQIAVMQGKMTELNAAVAMGALHQRDYAADLELVNVQRAEQIKLINDTPDADMSAQDKSNAIRNINKSSKDQTGVLDGAYAVTQRQDAAAIYANTTAGVITTGFNRIVNTWTNAGQQVVGLFESSINTINSTLVDVMTSRNRAHQIPREFEAMGHSIFANATGKSMQVAEGQIGKMLGFGGGAKVAHVHVDNWPGDIAGAASSMSGIAGKAAGWLGGLFGSKGGAPVSKIPSGGGYDFGSNPLASMAMDALPFFAGGGNFVANRPMLVGDMGPEILVPGNSGSIIPNHQIGGGTTHNISIDARGSTDPAATEAAIHRAMGQYLPAAVGASVGAVKEQSRRVPLSHR